MSSSLSKMITSEDWQQVMQVCQGSPSEAKKWTTRQGFFEGMKDANVLPIHEALVGGAPFAIIEALLNAYPDSVYCKESSYKRLPLHCACRKNAVPEVVDLLLRRYADAALTPDSLGRLPCKSICSLVTPYFNPRQEIIDKITDLPLTGFISKTIHHLCKSTCTLLNSKSRLCER